MKLWNSITVTCLVLALGIIALWIAHGRHIYTKDKVQVLTTHINPIFGTEETDVEWKSEFHLGLDYGAPTILTLLLAGGFSFYSRAKKYTIDKPKTG